MADGGWLARYTRSMVYGLFVLLSAIERPKGAGYKPYAIILSVIEQPKGAGQQPEADR